MSYQEDFDIAQRYDLLCRASQSNVEQDGQRLQLAADLDILDKIINYDLPELARSGSPDHFADILKNLNLELEHFREFCEFPDLAQKVVVGVGGAFSAGKSSLINTLLGKKRLVVEIDPTTSLPTYLLHGEQEQITALNLFRRRVMLSQDEFASLTHEEKIKYGSQIAGLLRSAFVSDPDFTWKNIALLDTPGYSKPDSEQWSERTDESVARSQLNLSNFIIWVVSATQGTISEDDLKFLVTLNADIPKLIVVSRADAKIPEDVAKIVALVKQTTAERGINVLDVIPVSARKKNDYPVQPIVEFLERWNEQKRSLSFAQNFKRHFVGYSQFVQGKQQQAKTKLEQINKLLFLSDHAEQTQIVEKLQHIEKDSNKEWNDLPKNLEELQNQFFKKMNQLADSIGGYKEQLVDIETLLKDPNCSAEILQSYAKRLDDEELLNLIYQHPNCLSTILDDVLKLNVGAISKNKLISILTNKNIDPNSPYIIKHIRNFSLIELLNLDIEHLNLMDDKLLSKIGGLSIDYKEIDKGIFWYERSASLGNIDAMNSLGVLYSKGIKINKEKALYWYKKAISLGSINSMNNIGVFYIEEDINKSKGIDLIKKAAELNNSDAINNLGIMGEKERNHNKAIYWYQKAAELGNVSAMNSMGFCYDHYLKKDDKAVFWYKKSAELGSINAMNNLGFLYNRLRKIEKAIFWYEKAASLHDSNAIFNINLLNAVKKKKYCQNLKHSLPILKLNYL